MNLQETKDRNETLFKKEFRERTEIPQCLPMQVDIEITTRCNLRCFTCPKTYSKEKGVHINRELFERFAQATFETARSVNLTGFGEPMLCPDFEYFFNKSVSAELEVGFITNGTLLSPSWLERFLQAKTHVFVSVDAATPQTSRLMRPQLDFDRLVQNLQLWNRLKAQNPDSKAHLRFNFVPTRKNVHELPGVIELAAKVGAERVEVLNMRLNDLAESARKESLVFHIPLARKWFGKAREKAEALNLDLILPPGFDTSVDDASAEEIARNVDTPVEVNLPGSKYPLACSAPWFRINVNIRGDVFPCCWYPFPMGNLVRENFDQIWHGEKYRKMRRRINTRFPHLGCKECLMIWGITAGMPEAIFRKEHLVDRMHTFLQKLRRNRLGFRKHSNE